MKKKLSRLEKIGLTLYWLLKSLIIIGLVFAFINQEWQKSILLALIVLVTYIPTIIKKKYRLYFPLEFDLFIIIFIFFSLFLGDLHNYYYKFWWWDLYLHGEYGLLAGILGFILIYILNEQKNIHVHMKSGFIAIFSFTFAMTLAVLWEMTEFTLDSLFNLNMQKSGLVDTMSDLIFGAAGALTTSLVAYLWMKNKIRFFVFDSSVQQFIKRNKHLFESDN